MEMIKSVKLINNIMEYNSHHDRNYLNKKGIIEIEFTNNKKVILDIPSGVDITDSDYISILKTNRTKEKVLFENILCTE